MLARRQSDRTIYKTEGETSAHASKLKHKTL